MSTDQQDRTEGLEGLVDSARRGDRDAFDELVRRTYRDTYTLARRLTGNDEDARDVVQDSYLRAWKSIRRFRGDARFGTWMYRITANCSVTYLQRRRKHAHEELDLIAHEREDAASTPTDEGALGRLELDRLALAVSQLPPRLRACVVLKDVYGLSHESIAEELEISVTAAKVRLHRGRKRLREILDEGEARTAHAV